MKGIGIQMNYADINTVEHNVNHFDKMNDFFKDLFIREQKIQYEKGVAVSEFKEFLEQSGKWFGDNLTENEQKYFLNRIIDEIPWRFSLIVGDSAMISSSCTTSNTSYSRNNFNLSKAEFENFDLSSGYEIALRETGKDVFKKISWIEKLKNGNKRAFDEWLVLMEKNPAHAIFHPTLAVIHDSKESILYDLFAESLSRDMRYDDCMEIVLPWLVRYGFNVNRKDSCGGTIAHVMAAYCPQHVPRFLPFLVNEYEMEINIHEKSGYWDSSFVNLAAASDAAFFKKIFFTLEKMNMHPEIDIKTIHYLLSGFEEAGGFNACIYNPSFDKIFVDILETFSDGKYGIDMNGRNKDEETLLYLYLFIMDHDKISTNTTLLLMEKMGIQDFDEYLEKNNKLLEIPEDPLKKDILMTIRTEWYLRKRIKDSFSSEDKTSELKNMNADLFYR